MSDILIEDPFDECKECGRSGLHFCTGRPLPDGSPKIYTKNPYDEEDEGE